MQLMNRSGLAAIAAATAFLSTPALAQDATPVTPDAAPVVADEALTVEPLPMPEAQTDTLAPIEGETAAPAVARTSRTANPARASAPRPKIVPVLTERPAAPVIAAPAAPTIAAVSPADPAMVAPLPEVAPATPSVPPSDSASSSDVLPIAGAAGLGLLALAGAGFAMRRRRRTDEDVMVSDEWHEPAMSRVAPLVTASTVAAPVVAAPAAASAFNWGSTSHEVNPSVSDQAPVDRIEAAKRGPTPDNPSLSLKKRLKRAAFFDQRDRAIAAGKAAPVPATAGLPEAMARPAPAARKRSPSFVDQGMRMSFGKTLQPA